MTLWWLQPGWTDACCASCGAKIWPEGDPDWGFCVQCFDQVLEQQRAEREAMERQSEEQREMEKFYTEHPHG